MQMENSRLKIEFLPESGGKITSFFHKEKEFELAAQSSAGKALTPPAGGSFAVTKQSDSEVSMYWESPILAAGESMEFEMRIMLQ